MEELKIPTKLINMYCIVLYLLCIHQIHTKLDIVLVMDYVELQLQNRK